MLIYLPFFKNKEDARLAKTILETELVSIKERILEDDQSFFTIDITKHLTVSLQLFSIIPQS